MMITRGSNIWDYWRQCNGEHPQVLGLMSQFHYLFVDKNQNSNTLWLLIQYKKSPRLKKEISTPIRHYFHRYTMQTKNMFSKMLVVFVAVGSLARVMKWADPENWYPLTILRGYQYFHWRRPEGHWELLLFHAQMEQATHVDCHISL